LLARRVGRRRSSARARPPSAPPHLRRRTRRAGSSRTAGSRNRTARGLCVTFDETVPDALTLSRTCRDLDVLITALTDKPIRLEEEFLRLTDRSSEAEHGKERPER